MKFALIAFTYSLETDRGTAAGPNALLRAGLGRWLREQGDDVAGPFHVDLTPAEQAAYGAWNKIGFVNADLARLVSEATRGQSFPLILQSNCYAAPGVLAGRQASTGTPSPRLGMGLDRRARGLQHTGNDAERHAQRDACRHRHGLSLNRLRQQAGLDPPMDPRDVVMVCVRENDPLEQELIDHSGIEIVPVADVKGEFSQLRAAMARLSRTVDLIYVHFDVDALDESEVASMRLTAPGGPMSTELAAALKILMAYPKVAALGIADINPEKDVEGQIVQAALSVIKGGIVGVAG